MAEEWGDYLGGRGLIRINFALREFAPNPSYPLLGWIAVDMNSFGPNGFPTEEEMPVLDTIESAISGRVVHQSVELAGSIQGKGAFELFYYLQAQGDFELAVGQAMNEFPTYRYEMAFERDPGWSNYLDLLYPKPYEIVAAKSRERWSELRVAGDMAEIPRMITHRTYFAESQAKAELLKWAERKGFAVKHANRGDFSRPYPWGAEVSKEETLLPGSCFSSAHAIAQKVDELKGIYDGWDCSPVTSVPPPKNWRQKLFGSK